MSHTCQNLLVRCMDFRLEPAISKWLRDNSMVGDVDVISVAGACKEFANVAADCVPAFLYSQVELSYRKHGVRRVILTQHEDCGAYGTQTAFESPAAEKSKLTSDMKRTKEILRTKYPDLQVSMFWLKRAGENWEFETVLD
jgi:carbonic anhydrase